MALKSILKKIKGLAKDSWYVYCMERKKLQPKTVLMESRNGDEIAGNILYLLKEMEEEEYREYKGYVAVNKEKMPEARELLKRYGIQRAELVERYQVKYFELLATAGYLVNDTTFPRRFIKREGQVYMNTWHGTSYKKLGKDIPSGAYAIGNVQRNLLMADYLAAPSPCAMERLSHSHNLENLYQGSYVYGGYPRNQVFFRQEEGERLRRELGLEGKKIYCYMPTWRGIVRENDAQKTGEQQADIIKRYLDELDKELTDNEVFFLRLHPFAGQRIDCTKYRHIEEFPKGHEPYQILNMADVLVTDYSSVFFDYANKKDGKIVLFLYDREDFREDRDYYQEPESLPFPAAEIAAELLRELRRPKEYDDSEFLKTYCAYDHRDAAKSLCRFLLKKEKGEHIAVKNAQSNGQKNLLFYVGGLRRNGLTASFLNLMEYVDREKYNYFVTFQEEYLRETPERIGILPEFAGLVPMTEGWNLTFMEAFASFLYYKKNMDNALVRKYLRRFYSREYRRNFGYAPFQWRFHFSGYERKVIGLFLEGEKKRAIFVHSDMLREIETRRNQHLLTLKRAYREYDMTLVVSRDIYERTLCISHKKENLHVVDNCHAYKKVLERAEGEIVFDHTTKCTVSREGLEERLLRSGNKFITIGRFSPEKGHEMLLEAFGEYHRDNPDSQLFIIGGGGELYQQEWEKAKALGLEDAVVLLMSVENTMPILKKCDLFLLSSIYEGLGLVLLEADTLGVPVVSTDITGPRSLMKEHGGYLVPPTREGLLEGMRAFDRGEVKALGVDYEAYNQRAVKAFERLLL